MARKSRQNKPVVTRIPLTEASINLNAIVSRVSAGNDCFILEKNGLPVAALMDIDEFEDYLELQDPEVNATIAESREEYLAGKSRPAEELLRELEEEEARARRRPVAATVGPMAIPLRHRGSDVVRYGCGRRDESTYR